MKFNEPRCPNRIRIIGIWYGCTKSANHAFDCVTMADGSGCWERTSRTGCESRICGQKERTIMSRTKKVGIKRNLTKRDVAKRKSKIMPNKPRPIKSKKRGRPPKPNPRVGETWDVRGHGPVTVEKITKTRIEFLVPWNLTMYDWKRTSFMRQAKPWVAVTPADATKRVIDSLTPRERDVLRDRFGITESAPLEPTVATPSFGSTTAAPTPVDPATDVRPAHGSEAAEGLEDGLVG